jgi:CRISPR-associated protein Csm3
MEKLVKKIKINSSLEVITGIHIGGSSDNVEIGGIDDPVIKIATKDNQPYIPGSSIKGKIRCLLEQISGSVEIGGNADVNKLFGSSSNNMPSKIIIRDAFLSMKSIDSLKNCDDLDMPFTESKYENEINRIMGTAKNPRQTERVPAGVSFDLEFIINIWDTDEDGKSLFTLFKKGINALENDYLGGSGSRGYGQVRFSDWKYSEASEKSQWKMEEVEELIKW